MVKLNELEKEVFLDTVKKMIFISGSQKRLAEDLGISTAAITRWIALKNLPSFSVCKRIKEKFGFEPEFIRPDIKMDWSKLNV